MVRQVFIWVGRERQTIGAVARRLTAAGVPTRQGGPRWDRTTIWDMLKNLAYKGEAAYGRTRSEPWQGRTTRPQRGKSAQPRRAVHIRATPPEEWITVPVPALVDHALFEAVQEPLRENRRRARERPRGARYLLQGLLVCGTCGYTLSGMVTRYRTQSGEDRVRGYYRCLGTDAYRFAGERPCHNPPLPMDATEAAIWAEVRALLEDTTRLEREYWRRWEDLRAATPEAEQGATQAHVSKLRQALARLIDGYADGLIEKGEFEPRVGRLRQRIALLEEQAQQATDEATARADVQLVVGRLDAFAVRVKDGLADADWHTRREIIRTLVKRIEVTADRIDVIFRISASALGPRAPGAPLQDCLPSLGIAAREGGARHSRRVLRHHIDRLRLQRHHPPPPLTHRDMFCRAADSIPQLPPKGSSQFANGIEKGQSRVKRSSDPHFPTSFHLQTPSGRLPRRCWRACKRIDMANARGRCFPGIRRRRHLGGDRRIDARHRVVLSYARCGRSLANWGRERAREGAA